MIVENDLVVRVVCLNHLSFSWSYDFKLNDIKTFDSFMYKMLKTARIIGINLLDVILADLSFVKRSKVDHHDDFESFIKINKENYYGDFYETFLEEISNETNELFLEVKINPEYFDDKEHELKADKLISLYIEKMANNNFNKSKEQEEIKLLNITQDDQVLNYILEILKS